MIKKGYLPMHIMRIIHVIHLLCITLLFGTFTLFGQPRTSMFPVQPLFTDPLDTILFVQNTQLPAPSTGGLNAVPRFSNNTLKSIKNSLVYIDDAGNIQLNGIIKNNALISWPSVVGPAGTFLGSDGMGNLIFAIPGGSGSGNVDTALPFTIDNSIVRTDTVS